MVAAASSNDARSTGLAALALLTLALAGGSLLHLLTRHDAQWGKA